MKNHLLLGSLLLMFAMCISAADVYPAGNSQSLIGTWKLISDKQVKADGSSSDLYGSSPLGQLIYDSHGHMSVHLLTPDLTKCGTQDRRKCPDIAARSAFDNYLGYWGRFKVSAGGKSVMHIIGACVAAGEVAVPRPSSHQRLLIYCERFHNAPPVL